MLRSSFRTLGALGAGLAAATTLVMATGLQTSLTRVADAATRADDAPVRVGIRPSRVSNGPGQSDVDIAVQHLAAQERAEALLAQLRAELGPRLGDSFLAEVGAVIGAHTGPGCIGVTVHRRS